MRGFLASLWAEGLKIRRSKILWATFAVAAFIIVMVGFMIFILKDPEAARKYGLIATKARITAGEASWTSYHNMLVQVDAILGLLGFGFITSWIFGREYSDRTVKDLLALPVPRHAIILSKFTAAAAWCLLLSVIVFPLWLLVGGLFGLPGWDASKLAGWLASYVAGNVLILLLAPSTAFFASVGKGYLAPLGFVVFVIAIVQITTIIGYGQYFPWAVPVYVMAGSGPQVPMLDAGSWIVFSIAVAAGFGATFAWWRFADQK